MRFTRLTHAMSTLINHDRVMSEIRNIMTTIKITINRRSSEKRFYYVEKCLRTRLTTRLFDFRSYSQIFRAFLRDQSPNYTENLFQTSTIPFYSPLFIATDDKFRRESRLDNDENNLFHHRRYEFPKRRSREENTE